MQIYKDPPKSTWPKLCLRPTMPARNLDSMISEVFRDVDAQGDQALRAYTEKFDGVAIRSVVVTAATMAERAHKTPLKVQQAIDAAYKTIRKFHYCQMLNTEAEKVETTQGVWCWREARAIERVGLYVPGGSAPLISTVLMLGVPAQLAGCRAIVLCTPPRPDGTIDPAICYASLKVGVTSLVRIGGIQAIAALALGTESIGKVDKIFGPGNQFVTAAKQYAAAHNKVTIDMPAGPSEQMVIADSRANPAYIAADLLSQAEHGPDSQVVLVTTSSRLVRRVQAELKRQRGLLPRQDIAAKALTQSFCVVFKTLNLAFEFANVYAPEHLILNIQNPEKYLAKIQNAGSVFLGSYSPESAGDYASGTNHTLPTNGWARSYGGVSLDSFVKKITFQLLSKKGLATLAPTIEILARAEGLEAHARAVSIRLRQK
jgi:histidinol dehydrogenase